MARIRGPEDWDDPILNIWDDATGGPGRSAYDDENAAYFFHQGFIANNADSALARQYFFEYMIDRGYYSSISDFDWDAWRDWYDSQ